MTDPKDAIENKFFVAGQMDAQGHAAEKRKIGSGGAVLALSKRLLFEAQTELASLQRQLQEAQQDRDAYRAAWKVETMNAQLLEAQQAQQWDIAEALLRAEAAEAALALARHTTP